MRLETILRRFPVAVDLGARHGAFAAALAGSDAAGKIDLLIETDLSPRMLAGRGGLSTVWPAPFAAPAVCGSPCGPFPFGDRLACLRPAL